MLSAAMTPKFCSQQTTSKCALASSTIQLLGRQSDFLAYDSTHMPNGRLAKVDNFINNENFEVSSFSARDSHASPAQQWNRTYPVLQDGEQQYIDRADVVCHIQTVSIDPEWQGHGLGLWAVERALGMTRVQDKCLVLLQPGSIGPPKGGITAAEVSIALSLESRTPQTQWLEWASYCLSRFQLELTKSQASDKLTSYW
jgi:GNAT superfamily N-acetyltransferase